MKYHIQLSNSIAFVKPLEKEKTWTESPKLQMDAQGAAKRMQLETSAFILTDDPIGYSDRMERLAPGYDIWKMRGMVFTLCNSYLNEYFPNKPMVLYLIKI